jgi:hypothetical protein
LMRVVTIGAAIFVMAAVPAIGQTAKPATKTAPSKAAAAKTYKTPKTSWGDPDLAGVYTNNDESGIPLERPREFDGKKLDDISDSELAELRKERNDAAVARAPNLGVLPGSNPVHWFENFGAKNSRAWLVVIPPDGRVPPLVAEAQSRRAPAGGSSFGNGPFNTYLDFSLYDRCITRGVPGSMMPAIYGNAYAIVQGPGYVVMTYEMVHEARVIPLDPRPHVGGSIRMYMGDARGHWEGNTLVVETTNFTDKTSYRGSSEHLRLVERFTRTGPDTVEWSSTFDDAHTWTVPWTFAMALSKKDESQRPFEYACHEGNYAMWHLLSAARADEKAGRNGRDDEAPR